MTEWHINADEPNVLDYNEDVKSVGQLTSTHGSHNRTALGSGCGF